MGTKGSEYQKAKSGDVTVFTVTPAQAPKFMFMVIFGAILFLGGLVSIASGGFAVIFMAMGAFCLWYGWKRDQRPKPHQATSTFRVSPTGIEAEGRSVAASDIHRLILRNGITDQELNIGGNYQITAAQGEGMARRAMLAKISNSLTAEAGGKAIFLAGGMDETTAYGLLREVNSILGFTERQF